MSQEYDDLNQPRPAWEEPATPPAFPPLPDASQRVSDPYLPEVPVQPRPPSGQPIPAALPEHSPERARLERLRRLRQQRQQSARLPELSRYQRQGIPPPPPPPPSLKALLKHWWEHGPFAPPTPRAPAPPKPPPKLPAGKATARPLETRVRAWIARGQRELPHLLGRLQKTMEQAKSQASAQSSRGQKRAGEERIIPGLIVLGFDFTVSREAAVQIIASVGGKALRYKADIHQFQVAVPLGQEAALVAQYRQVPGVIYADLERASRQ